MTVLSADGIIFAGRRVEPCLDIHWRRCFHSASRHRTKPRTAQSMTISLSTVDIDGRFFSTRQSAEWRPSNNRLAGPVIGAAISAYFALIWSQSRLSGAVKCSVYTVITTETAAVHSLSHRRPRAQFTAELAPRPTSDRPASHE